jgi:hypothetical protein
MRPRWRPLITASAACAMVAGLSCYPGDVESVQEADLSIAIRNPSVPESQFQTIVTFGMPDTVLQIYPDTTDDNPPQLTRLYDDFILSEVAAHLESRGYVRDLTPDPGSPPDVLVLVTATARTFSGAVWYPGWWWGWYWPPYGGCYYCYYPPGYIDYYEWDQGTLMITMVDPSAPTDSTIQALWAGAVTGVMASATATQSRLEVGIDRVFALSPYLHQP